MKFNKTAIGVVAFIILLVLAGFSAKYSNADEGVSLGIGQTVINSHLKMAELSYYHDNWEVAAALTEDGMTKNGMQGNVDIYSVSHLTRPSWKVLGGDNYYRLGIAYVDQSPLVGPSNFRLGIGIDWDVFSLEYAHYSSSGIHTPNTGIDAIVLKYHFPD